MLGRQISRQLFSCLKDIVFQVLLSTLGMFVLSLATGVAIYCLADISLTTALIAGAAGGITEMTIFGMSAGADVVVILFMQVLRVLLSLTLSPCIALFIEKAVPRKNVKIATPRPSGVSGTRFFKKCDYAALTGVALLGAYAFIAMKIPNGAMMGAMLAGGLLALCIKKNYRFDPKIRCVAQIVLGLVIGQRITPDVAGQLRALFLPALAAGLVMLAGSVLLALFLYKMSAMELSACILCTSPAGLSQIAFFAEEIGADSLTLSIFHICRLLAIIAFYPWIVTLIA